MRAVCSNETSCRLSHNTSTSLIDELEKSLKDLKRQCETLQTQNEATKMERDLRYRMDQKISEMKDSQSSDQKLFNNKITLLKNEMAISLLDKDTFEFIKKVKQDWNHLVSRQTTYER